MNIDKSSLESIVREVVEKSLSSGGGAGGGSPASSVPPNGQAIGPICDLPNAGALKEKLARDEPTYGIWGTIDAPVVTEMAARMGGDWVVIDAEHGYLDMRNVMEHIRVANLANVPILVRIAEIQEGLIKRIMDIGADGIVVPQVRTANELATAVRWTKYPPEGKRGIGAERATRWGMGIEQCVPRANKNSMVVSMMETVEAGEAIEELMNVPGVDAFFFGGHDYSASAGFTGTASEPPVVEKLDSIQRTIRERRMPSGIVTFDTKQIPQRLDQGFRMIGIGFDTTLLIRALSDALADAGRPVQESMWW